MPDPRDGVEGEERDAGHFPIQRIVKAKKGKVIRARVRFRFRKALERRKSIILSRSFARTAATRRR